MSSISVFCQVCHEKVCECRDINACWCAFKLYRGFVATFLSYSFFRVVVKFVPTKLMNVATLLQFIISQFLIVSLSQHSYLVLFLSHYHDKVSKCRDILLLPYNASF